jgi:Tol biopolymer transport system component
MGEVYRARDTRLDREVAVKILAASLASDPARRDRFEREARIVSSLNHPNICALYDVGRDNDHDFLVLEYLEGEPLDRRLARSKGQPLPLGQALSIAIQIADALDKAHRVGIVHRDLKPGNIFLTKSAAKLLDFGLAKVAGPAVPMPARPPERIAAPPFSFPRELTMDGTIVGTFLYMAPEQLAGEGVDARTDIFAFGLVLYEMLTGRRPFEDHDNAGVITAVFDREAPPLMASVPSLPLGLDRLVRTCLAKDPDDRFQSAHDLLLQLRWAAEPAAESTVAVAAEQSMRRWRFVAALALVAAAGALARSLLRTPAPVPVPAALARFAYDLPIDQNFSRPGRRPLALSPDGTRLLYVANRQIYLKSISDLDAAPIRGTNDDPSDASFSSDGQWVMYWSVASGELKKIPVTGGASTALGKTLNPSGSSWSGERIFVSQGKHGILEMPAAGGPSRQVVAPKDGEDYYGPELLPDGNTLLFTVRQPAVNRWDDATIVAQSIATGVRKTLVQGGTDAHYSAGRLIYLHDSEIFAVPFDSRRLELTGPAVSLVTGVEQAGASITGAGYYAFSTTGTLVYVRGDANQRRTIVMLDRQGRESAIPAPPRAYTRARLSPDGSRIALEVRDLDTDVWQWDLQREVLTRLTFDRADERSPIWMPDSRRIVYMSDAGGGYGLYRLAVDGTSKPERLTTDADVQSPLGISPDGKVLAFLHLLMGTANYEIKTLELDGDRTPRPMATARFPDAYIAVSPDGKWCAYASVESGRSEVYVQGFPTPGGPPLQISRDGGTYPVWPSAGHELLYLDPARRMMAVPVKTGGDFSVAKPEPLFTANYYTMPVGRAFDVSEDGRRFVMIKDDQPSSRRFIFVQHWLDEVAARVR